jgi:anaerobic selenocysteine-containing dehydrogenase
VLLTSGAFSGDEAVLTHPQLLGGQTPRINMIQLGHALTAYTPKIRALVVYSTNPLTVAPDSSMVHQGLAREDLFTLVHEQVMTPTARYADLLLPATTFLENEDVFTAYGHFYCGVVKPAIEPLGEARSNFDFIQALAQRMGFDDPPFNESCEERMHNYLSSMEGIDERCKVDDVLGGQLVHSTRSRPDGKVMLGADRYRFVAEDCPDGIRMPCLTVAGEAANVDLRSRYPFHLLTPPHPDLLNSTFGEGYLDESGLLLIHPEDAKAAQIAEGDRVEIYNDRGSSQRIARLTTDTPPGVVVAEGLYWGGGPAMINGKAGLGINALTSQNTTDLGEGAIFHECLVALRAQQEQ